MKNVASRNRYGRNSVEHGKPAIAKNKKDVAMLCFIYETLACFYKTKEKLATN
jgi:hypothetical protein